MAESETTAVQINFNLSTDQAFSREAVLKCLACHSAAMLCSAWVRLPEIGDLPSGIFRGRFSGSLVGCGGAGGLSGGGRGVGPAAYQMLGMGSDENLKTYFQW
jgi:hypothetical protein